MGLILLFAGGWAVVFIFLWVWDGLENISSGWMAASFGIFILLCIFMGAWDILPFIIVVGIIGWIACLREE